MSECESCGEKELINTLITSDATYKLCSNCLALLINYSLTPEMFNSLIKVGHNSQEFYLHDDFYDENGVCLQPNKLR